MALMRHKVRNPSSDLEKTGALKGCKWVIKNEPLG